VEQNGADVVRWRMQQLRSEVGKNVTTTMGNARAMLNWRHYFSAHPWACLTVAAAVGFLSISKRPKFVRAQPQELAELAKSCPVVIQSSASRAAASSAAALLMSALASALLRSAVSQLSQHAERLLRARAVRNKP
jgi:ElaB/YqjD/DUF883 family membrane-anchored ribosome-binding protein